VFSIGLLKLKLVTSFRLLATCICWLVSRLHKLRSIQNRILYNNRDPVEVTIQLSSRQWNLLAHKCVRNEYWIIKLHSGSKHEILWHHTSSLSFNAAAEHADTKNCGLQPHCSVYYTAYVCFETKTKQALLWSMHTLFQQVTHVTLSLFEWMKRRDRLALTSKDTTVD
jgi:hypothetical protein